MATASRSRASDRAGVIKKLVPLLKKQYKVTVPKSDRPVLETLLFGVCLENASVEQAESTFDKLFKTFPDLNEARVSSITELEALFGDDEERAIRSMRLKQVLSFVFEKNYTWEFEALRKKTLELAQKQLAKVRHLTPFVRNYTLHYSIGAHVLPIDQRSADLLVWLGLSSPDQSTEDVGESLRAVIRKAESEQFCFALRALATDKAYRDAFRASEFAPPPEGWDAADGIERTQELFKLGFKAYKAKYGAPPAAEPKAAAGKKAKVSKKPEPVAEVAPVAAAPAAPAKAATPKAVPAPKAAAVSPPAKSTTKAAEPKANANGSSGRHAVPVKAAAKAAPAAAASSRASGKVAAPKAAPASKSSASSTSNKKPAPAPAAAAKKPVKKSGR